jgi:hypothetical protein
MPTFSINPPPQDRRCECCGRHISELKPFGKAGNPLVGDFDGAMLVKTFRTMCPSDEKIDAELKEIENMEGMKNSEGYLDYDKFIVELERRHGKEEADGILFYSQASGTVSASWECRDCIVLYDKEYFDVCTEKVKKDKEKNAN